MRPQIFEVIAKRLALVGPLLTLIALTTPGCGDNYIPAVGCETDSDCRAPRICMGGLCTDPTDTGEDTGLDTFEPDTIDPDVDPDIPDVPDPRACAALDPGFIDFGIVPLFEPAMQVATVSNCGTIDVTLTGATTGGWPFDAWIDGPAVLAAGETSLIFVEMMAEEPGDFSDTLTVFSTAGALTSELHGAVTGGELPCVSLPESWNFGFWEIGSTTTQAIPVTNCGDVPLMLGANIEPISAWTEEFVLGPLRPLPLMPGETQWLDVFYQPLQPVRVDATLSVWTDWGVGALSTLTGTGMGIVDPPCLDVSETDIDFGLLPAGEDGVRIVTLTNCGTTEITFGETTMDGDTEDFIGAPMIDMLAPGEAFDLFFSALGDRPGAHSAIWRVFPLVDSLAPVVISMRSQVEGSGAACIRVAEPLLNFGSIDVGDRSTRTAVLENCGDVPLTFNRVAIEGPHADYFGMFAEPPAALPVGGSVSIDLMFFPPEPGSFRADLRVDAGVTDTVVTLMGTGLSTAMECLDYPEVLDFGLIHEDTTLTLPIRNCGTDTVTLSNLSVPTGDFTGLTSPVTIPAGATSLVAFTALRTTPGPHLADATFMSEATRYPITFVSEVAPDSERCLDFAPDALVFEPATVGAGRVTLRATLSNCGDTTLTNLLGQLTPADPDLSFVLPTTSLASGASTTVSVTFAPTIIGEHVATLRVQSLDGTRADLAIEAEAIAAPTYCLEATESVVDFGTMGLGEGVAGNVTVRNCGDATLPSLIIDGSGAPSFSVSGSSAALAPGTTRTLPVSFEAVATGTFNEFLAIHSAADSVLVELRATVESPLTGCLEVNPESLDFGTVPLDADVVVVQDVEVRNCGTASLAIDSTLLGDRGFSTSSGSYVLAAGASRTQSVLFTASGTVGTLTSVLRLESAGPDGRLLIASVALTAEVEDTGVRCMEPVLPEVDFGTVAPGERVTRDVAFRNCGDRPLTFESGTLGGDTEFRPATIPPFGDVLMPGAIHTFVIAFQADAEGTYRALGEALYSDGISTSASMVAQVVAEEPPRLTVSPASVAFGAVDDGRAVSSNLSVCNAGGGSLTFNASVTTSEPNVTLTPSTGTLAAGACTTVRVNYTARAEVGEVRAWTGTARFTAGAAGTVNVPLSGSAVGATATPCLSVTPTSIALGPVAPGETAASGLTFSNCGDVPLELLSISATQRFISIDDFTPPFGSTLAPGESGSIRLTAVSSVPGRFTGDVVIATDQIEQSARVVLTVEEPGSCLDWSPGEVNLGPIEPGMVATETVTLTNCGDLPIMVHDAFFDGDRFLRMAIIFGDLGMPLEPGDRFEVEITYNPSSEGDSAGELIFITDYEAQPEIFVPVSGTCDETVVCETPRVRSSLAYTGPYRTDTVGAVDEALFLDAGFTSFDGDVVWSLSEAPTGANDVFESTSTIGRVRYIPNVTGTYVFQMHYESPVCGAGDRFLEVEVRDGRVDGIRVVITWRCPGDDDPLADPGPDIDLHMVRRELGGRTRWNTDADCYFGNCHEDWGGLEWGDPSYDGDNARLLRDEVEGTGPEIIVVDDPESDVEYIVGVHYWSDDGMGHSDITLRIFIDGIQREFAFDTLNRTGEVWLAARIAEAGDVVEILDDGVFSSWPAATLP